MQADDLNAEIAEPGAFSPALRQDDPIARLEDELSDVRRELFSHKLYPRLGTTDALRIFMQHHVFAVWDFMSLLKALQRQLTSVELPWRPVGDAATRRLINELVLEEESDEIDGVAIGHFEFYLRAMQQAGADTRPIRLVLDAVGDGASVDAALTAAGAPASARAFVATTFALIGSGQAHVIASAFTFGREDAIAPMFTALSSGAAADPSQTHLFRQYLHRHVELDGGEHGPKATLMLRRLCGDDELRWHEATEAARIALQARVTFWSAIEAELARAHEASDRVREPA